MASGYFEFPLTRLTLSAVTQLDSRLRSLKQLKLNRCKFAMCQRKLLGTGRDVTWSTEPTVSLWCLLVVLLTRLAVCSSAIAVAQNSSHKMRSSMYSAVTNPAAELASKFLTSLPVASVELRVLKMKITCVNKRSDYHIGRGV